MAQKKFDGVVESVRLEDDGKILTVRVYERRGPTWSDRIIIDRKELIRRLKNGKIYLTGKRKPYLASTFELGVPLKLAGKPGEEVVLTTDAGDKDDLQGVPLY